MSPCWSTSLFLSSDSFYGWKKTMPWSIMCCTLVYFRDSTQRQRQPRLTRTLIWFSSQSRNNPQCLQSCCKITHCPYWPPVDAAVFFITIHDISVWFRFKKWELKRKFKTHRFVKKCFLIRLYLKVEHNVYADCNANLHISATRQVANIRNTRYELIVEALWSKL